MTEVVLDFWNGILIKSKYSMYEGVSRAYSGQASGNTKYLTFPDTGMASMFAEEHLSQMCAVAESLRR